MKNSQLILITESNVTADLVDQAFNSTMGLHYETESKLVRKMIKEGAQRAMKQIRK